MYAVTLLLLSKGQTETMTAKTRNMHIINLDEFRKGYANWGC